MKQPRKRSLSHFFASQRGQIFATWCARSALGCVAICAFLTDYSRLATPFVIVAPFLSYIGTASRSHRRLARVALALWVIPLSSLFHALPDLNNQASQQARLQQQTIQLENQHNNLQDEQAILQKQQPLLQKQLSSIKNQDQLSKVASAWGDGEGSLSYFRIGINYTSTVINKNTRILLDNDRNVSDSLLIQKNDQAIRDSDTLIKLNISIDARQVIDRSNALLPADENVPFVPGAYQNDCVSGYPCLTPFSWQQPFIDGWQGIVSEPFSITWIFWLPLLLALLGIFILLPLDLIPGWVVSYWVAYSGPLSMLKDPAFPKEKRRELAPTTSIVKIEVDSSLTPMKSVDNGEEAWEFLRLNLGLGTTILDVFLKPNVNVLLLEGGFAEAYHDKTTGNIILQLRTGTPRAVRQAKGAQKFGIVGNFPVQMYIVVDHFSGSVSAETPITDVTYVQEQRGPGCLGGMASLCHALVWWVFAVGCSIALSVCSFTFFDSPVDIGLLWFFVPWGLGVTIVALITKIVELIITKTTIRRQKTNVGESDGQLKHSW